jgi:hypothetical protein
VPCSRHGGNVFIVTGGARQGPGGGPSVDVQWTSARQLRVRYDPRARTFRKESAAVGVDIRYDAVAVTPLSLTEPRHQPDGTWNLIVGDPNGRAERPPE